MTGNIAIKYRAFLSYSHADTALAARVHQRLERFRIDADLAGRTTAMGPVPKTLAPVFRDRHDFDAGGGLGDQTLAAIDASAALVLIASPRSAKSTYVNEEVRLFRARHPERPVIPLIIDGTPGDISAECFPAALRFALDGEGLLTVLPENVLAADWREQGDGPQLALAKIVARLLGLPPDDIFRRAKREQRRVARLRQMVAAVVAVLALAGAYFWMDGRQKQQTLAELSALADKYVFIQGAQAAPGSREALIGAFTALAQGAGDDPRYAKALALLKDGKAAEAQPLVQLSAEEEAAKADKSAKSAAKKFRTAAAIAAVADPAKARANYAEAARLDPDDVEGMYQHGCFQDDAGALAAAEIAYKRVLAIAKPGVDDDRIIWSKLTLGDIQMARGDLSSAMTIYANSRAIAQKLAEADPTNGVWQRDLSVSINKTGDVLAAQGNLTNAMTSFRESLAIAQRLAKLDPDNTIWRRDLSIAISRAGDTLFALGDFTEALTIFRDGLSISARLAAADTRNARYQRDISVYYDKIGDVLAAQGNLAEAGKSFQDGRAISEQLQVTDPDNAGWQRVIAVSYAKLGNTLVAQDKLPEALQNFRSALDIVARLIVLDSGNTQWLRDVALFNGKTGEVLVAQGNFEEALKSFLNSRAISAQLATLDPRNVVWQNDLAFIDEKIGDALMAQGDLAEAFKNFAESLDIRKQLAGSNLSNPEAPRDVSRSLGRLASVYLENGDIEKARALLATGRAIMLQLTELSSDNAAWAGDLAWFNSQLAALPQDPTPPIPGPSANP